MEGWVYPNKAEVSTPRLRGRREYYPELLLSWFSSVTIIGNLVGAPVGGYLLYQFGVCHTLTLTNFQTIYLVSGAAGVLALLLALTALKREAPPASGRGLQESLHRFLAGIKEVISDRRVVVTSSMEGLQNLTVGALEAFLPIYAVKVAGLNEFQAGLLWEVQVLVTILAKPIMGKTSDQYGRTPLVALGMVLCTFSFAAILLLRNFYAPDHGHGVWTGRGPGHLSAAALVADICQEKHFGTAMGTFGTIFDVGHASGPILAGLLIARLDYFPSFLILAALLIVATPVFLLLVNVGQGKLPETIT